MQSSSRVFLDDRRLLAGPWQAFERDVARLLALSGHEDVRLIGGSGDKGCDILSVCAGKTWVVQCKYTSSSYPTTKAISEVMEAGRAYEADHLAVAVSRMPGETFHSEIRRVHSTGLPISVLDPRALMVAAARVPEYPSQRRQLRPYQREAAELFQDSLLETGKALLVFATGLGKTVVMAEVVADMMRSGQVGNRVLVLAHTRDLVNQLHRAFWAQLPSWISTHQLSDGEEPAYWEGITFATVQSVSSRLNRMPEFDLVLVDEAHHIGSETFSRTLETLRPRFVGGVTATPWRGDGFDISTVLGHPVARVGIAEGLRQGFLSEVDYRLFADNIDWSFVQSVSRNRYSVGELNKRLLIPTRDEEAAREVQRAIETEKLRSGIVFSPTVLHAETFAALLRQFGLRAESISSYKSAREREMLMSRFRAGKLDIVTTVDLFNEGVDVPDVDLVVFLRATHSRRIFVQQLGRGLRVSPGKSRVVVLDFVSDLRRIAEVVVLDREARGGDVERLGLGSRLIQFANQTAGPFMREWMLDQADLMLREDDATLEIPRFNFPDPLPPGTVA